MRITRLELKHHRGFKLRQIKHFIYEPTKKTQVILGTNGSGKSTLLRELSPLPGSKDDYRKGGFKIIEIEHNKHHYKLSSLFDHNGTRYVFEVDGENLNPGHTLTVYKELVKQHFNYTPERHAVMTGLSRFHAMSVAERRNEFNQFGVIDFDYALKYHRRTKDKIRDIQGTLNQLQPRLVQELQNVCTEKDIEEIKLRVQFLREKLDLLLNHRRPPSGDLELRSRVDSQRIEIERILTLLDQLLSSSEGNYQGDSTESLKALKISLEQSLLNYQNTSIEYCEELNKLHQEKKTVELTSGITIEEVQKAILNLEQEKDEGLTKLRFDFHFDDPAATLSQLNAVSEALESITTRLDLLNIVHRKREQGIDFTSFDIENAREEVFKQQQNQHRIQKSLEELLNKKKLMDSDKDKEATECPKCHHSFHIHYNAAVYARLESDIKLMSDLKVVADKKVADANETLEELKAYFGIQEEYSRNVKHFDLLKPFWNYVCQNNLITFPTKILSAINTLRKDLQLQVTITHIRTRIEEQKKLEATLINAGNVDKEKLNKTIELLEEKNVLLHTRIRNDTLNLTTVKNKLNTLLKIYDLKQSLDALLRTRDSGLRSLVEDDCIFVLDCLIREIRIELSSLEYRMSQVNIHKAVVKSLEEQIEQLKKDQVLLKQIEKAISPSEGLIAQGMTKFINHFVEQLNSFISKIWLYPLELVPVEHEPDSVDLDYKFKVMVNGDPDDLSPDIEKTSAGMQEIIDLAYVAVSMFYHGLNDFPIYLDEFAKGFDHRHRQAAYQAIDYLIASREYSQVFLVSHYQDGYSNLSDSEVLVLCDSNIQIPSSLSYNNHVSIL